MKKLLTSLTVLAFFVPFVSFAQTTSNTTYSPQYIALLEQLLQVLEQELTSIESSSATPASTTISTMQPQTVTTANVSTENVQVIPGITEAYLTTGGMYYEFPLTIDNNTNTPIYVPISAVQNGSNTAGFAYTLNGDISGTVSSSVNCAPQSYVNEASGSVQVCTIPAGESVKFDINLTLAPSVSGDGSVTLNSMSYAQDTGSAPATWTLLPIVNDTTSEIASGPVAPVISSSSCSTEYSNIDSQVREQMTAAGAMITESQIEEMVTQKMESAYPSCGY